MYEGENAHLAAKEVTCGCQNKMDEHCLVVTESGLPQNNRRIITTVFNRLTAAQVPVD